MIYFDFRLMWVELWSAGYEPLKNKPVPETWQQYLKRADMVVKQYRKERVN